MVKLVKLSMDKPFKRVKSMRMRLTMLTGFDGLFHFMLLNASARG